jgi:serine protease
MRLPSPLLLVAAATLLAACDESPTGNRPNSNLLPGQSVTISGAADSERSFLIEVPAGTGTLQVVLTGGAGDADLVIRQGAAPETGLYDCVSESESNEEECLIDTPLAGTWHVLVVGFEAYNNVRLTANLGATSGAVPLQTGVPVAGLAGGAGSFKMYSITVPAGATSLDVTLNGPNGDADLYLRQATFPLLNQFDQASFTPASIEQVTQPNPVAGTWYVRVEGFTAYTGATLTATVTLAPPLRAGR